MNFNTKDNFQVESAIIIDLKKYSHEKILNYCDSLKLQFPNLSVLDITDNSFHKHKVLYLFFTRGIIIPVLENYLSRKDTKAHRILTSCSNYIGIKLGVFSKYKTKILEYVKPMFDSKIITQSQIVENKVLSTKIYIESNLQKGSSLREEFYNTLSEVKKLMKEFKSDNSIIEKLKNQEAVINKNLELLEMRSKALSNIKGELEAFITNRRETETKMEKLVNTSKKILDLTKQNFTLDAELSNVGIIDYNTNTDINTENIKLLADYIRDCSNVEVLEDFNEKIVYDDYKLEAYLQEVKGLNTSNSTIE